MIPVIIAGYNTRTWTVLLSKAKRNQGGRPKTQRAQGSRKHVSCASILLQWKSDDIWLKLNLARQNGHLDDVNGP